MGPANGRVSLTQHYFTNQIETQKDPSHDFHKETTLRVHESQRGVCFYLISVRINNEVLPLRGAQTAEDMTCMASLLALMLILRISQTGLPHFPADG